MNTLSLRDTRVLLLGSADQDYRARAMAYLQAAGCQGSVIDGVTEGQLLAALKQALDQVDSPFVVLARDSDFLLIDALQQAQDWLHAHPQVMGVQGYALGMQPGNSTVSYYRLGRTAHQVLPGGLRDRVQQYGISGLQPWRAVLRVEALRSALDDAARQMADQDWLLGLSFALLCQGDIKVLEQTQVVSECVELAVEADAMLPAIRTLRQWDEQQAGDFAGEEGFAILRQFALSLGAPDPAPLLFVSPWASVVNEPERSFEARQYVELPYYNAALFRQLSALEFLQHAWPAGQAHVRALEGAWVRQRDLLQQHANDNVKTLRTRYWQALSVNLFAPQICSLLLATLADDEDDARHELQAWIERLQQAGAPPVAERLAHTPSGRVLQALAQATLDDAGRQRVRKHLKAGRRSSMALLVIDLADDDEALQRTFDSVVASGLSDLRIVVLKAGQLPAITTVRDTLHFIKVMPDTLVSHLNQVVRQLPSDWLMLLQAGDELAGSGLLRLQVELAQAGQCTAVCGNEVQRDVEGRLIAIQRPGADVDLLRSRPDLMAQHWLLRREVLLDVGGYSDACRQALEFDLLLRVIEARGLGGLAHVDEYLVVGQIDREAMQPGVLATLDRHLGVLGYQAQVVPGREGRLDIEFRHAATPMVSILLSASGDMQQLGASLASIQQRTRYPRYEVLVVGEDEQLQQANLGGRVRVVCCPSQVQSERFNQAAGQARGEYLVLMSDRSLVANPGWIEALLNQAQRPEVGVVGCQMYGADGSISHAGYELLEDRQVHASWLGVAGRASADVLALEVVRASHAVSADGLMVRKEVFEALGGLPQGGTPDIELCLQVSQAGLLVLVAPQAQLFNGGVPVLTPPVREALVARAPWAFARALAVDGAYGIGEQPGEAGPRWLRELG
ncbi:glycosyltransferase [Pseudomonas sp. NPDC087029]|uniref:glycosyltransferase family 2 protein n=1 Tax=Pseudomonas sp. NPDC087029 TaxID=3364433 RepID=UPI003805B4DD